MGPKKDIHSDLKKEDIIQAVVIADPFNKKYGRLTSSSVPKCLLPLANRPILSYTLDCLKGSHVQEVILYCTNFAADVRKYLADEALKGDRWSTLNIMTIGNEDCRSLGDAMRDIDAKGLLRNDFIIITSGDTVSNANLEAMLDQHKKNFRQDKNATMTLVYKKAAPGHHCRSLEQEVVVAASPQGRLLHHARAVSKNLQFPKEIFTENESVDLRFDFLETGIAICSQAVPPLFSDNFDCNTLDEFIKGTLEDELTDHTIYVYSIDDEAYAARLHNLHSYMAITKDVVRRWVFPIVPEAGESHYSYLRRNVYKAKDVIIGSQSILEEDVIIGQGSKVGEHTRITLTTIGKNCSIGDRVILRDCVVHDDVVIGDDCVVEGAVLGSKVRLGHSVNIQEKCILGAEVEIKSNMKLPAGTRLVSSKESDGFSDDPQPTSSEFGPAAFVYDSDEEDADSVASGEGPGVQHDPWGVSLQSSEDDSSSSDDDGSEISNMEDFGKLDIMHDDDAKYDVFFGEVLESLQRGAKEGVKADNLALEVNSSRHAYAVTPIQVIQSVYVSILTIAKCQEGSVETSGKLFAACKKSLNQFKLLLMNYIKSKQAQTNCLDVISEHASSNPEFMPIVANIVHFLHDQDILSEEAILAWYPGLAMDGPIKEKLKTFIEWLEQDSEDSDEEDEDED